MVGTEAVPSIGTLGVGWLMVVDVSEDSGRPAADNSSLLPTFSIAELPVEEGSAFWAVAAADV